MFAGKLIGLEMMAVMQMSYMSLMTLSSMNPCFKALSKLEFVNGFNYFSLSKQYLLDQDTPASVKGLKLSSLFIQNYNFTILFLFCTYLISLITLILSKTKYKSRNSTNLFILAKKCTCQIGLIFLLFSGYIIGVSLAL